MDPLKIRILILALTLFSTTPAMGIIPFYDNPPPTLDKNRALDEILATAPEARGYYTARENTNRVVRINFRGLIQDRKMGVLYQLFSQYSRWRGYSVPIEGFSEFSTLLESMIGEPAFLEIFKMGISAELTENQHFLTGYHQNSSDLLFTSFLNWRKKPSIEIALWALDLAIQKRDFNWAWRALWTGQFWNRLIARNARNATAFARRLATIYAANGVQSQVSDRKSYYLTRNLCALLRAPSRTRELILNELLSRLGHTEAEEILDEVVYNELNLISEESKLPEDIVFKVAMKQTFFCYNCVLYFKNPTNILEYLRRQSSSTIEDMLSSRLATRGTFAREYVWRKHLIQVSLDSKNAELLSIVARNSEPGTIAHCVQKYLLDYRRQGYEIFFLSGVEQNQEFWDFVANDPKLLPEVLRVLSLSSIYDFESGDSSIANLNFLVAHVMRLFRESRFDPAEIESLQETLRLASSYISKAFAKISNIRPEDTLATAETCNDLLTRYRL